MPELDPAQQRRFAIEVVRKLRAAGYQALWAGGCVRDLLLNRTPKDYDVATNAEPTQIRELFGFRRTLAIGAAFGVITVLGSSDAGMIEVATFRRDLGYSDGRRPDNVAFSDAQEDAQRRDFTINGLFYDPVAEQVIDFVGGQEDLARRVIRAIGDPVARFTEDKLRLLRAVRFAATFQFALEERTLEAIRPMAPGITAVSTERITAELQRMLTAANRSMAVRLLIETGLAAVILPEIVPGDDAARTELEHTLRVLDRLARPGFALSLAVLLIGRAAPASVLELARRWRLANRDSTRAAWLIEHRQSLDDAPRKPWSTIQPLLADEGGGDLVAMVEAEAQCGRGDLETAAWCRAQLSRPREDLDPPPLINGDDLTRHGMRPGPAYRPVLDRLRQMQLDGQVTRFEDALAEAKRQLAANAERGERGA